MTIFFFGDPSASSGWDPSVVASIVGICVGLLGTLIAQHIATQVSHLDSTYDRILNAHTDFGVTSRMLMFAYYDMRVFDYAESTGSHPEVLVVNRSRDANLQRIAELESKLFSSYGALIALDPSSKRVRGASALYERVVASTKTESVLENGALIPRAAFEKQFTNPIHASIRLNAIEIRREHLRQKHVFFLVASFVTNLFVSIGRSPVVEVIAGSLDKATSRIKN